MMEPKLPVLQYLEVVVVMELKLLALDTDAPSIIGADLYLGKYFYTFCSSVSGHSKFLHPTWNFHASLL